MVAQVSQPFWLIEAALERGGSISLEPAQLLAEGYVEGYVEGAVGSGTYVAYTFASVASRRARAF